jgi:hypothetical protein
VLSRKGSKQVSLPLGYSMTSSARASSVGGTSVLYRGELGYSAEFDKYVRHFAFTAGRFALWLTDRLGQLQKTNEELREVVGLFPHIKNPRTSKPRRGFLSDAYCFQCNG